MAISAKTEKKIEIWKNKLLDLGRRNKLLNYKDTAKSSLRITQPDCDALYNTLVRNEATIAFPRPLLEQSDELETGASEQLQLFEDEQKEEPDDYGGYGSILRTNKKPADLQKVLRSLRNKAKTAMEEQGINILYLSFGFLNWTEVEHSRNVYSSPLILVPVTLTIESITSPFTLSLHEDEIVVNPTLAYKLSSEYGITLPTFDDSEDPTAFLNRVRNAVRDQGWTVSSEVAMSLLSFLKINMYADLKQHHDRIVANPIVRALSGDATALAPIPSGIADYDFDKNENPKDVFQVVDADASQQEAILMAKKGVSFILQGPPGTGKSQTITNIIAEKLAEGKKVLFVSEKMAALEVVHRRLAAAGLDDFCLVLHSYKTSKRSVLDQLEAVLSLSQKKARLSDEAYRKLDNLQYDRQKLNDYAEQVFTVVEPLERTIYEVNGIIANLENYDDVIFPIDNIKAVTPKQYDQYLFMLEQFAASIGKMTDDYKHNPWRGAKLSAVTNEFRHDANAKLSVLLPVLENANATVSKVYTDIYSTYPKSVNGLIRAEKVLDALQGSHEVPVDWVLEDVSAIIPKEISHYSEAQAKCKALVSDIRGYLISLAKEGTLEEIDEAELFDIDTQKELAERINSILNYQAPYYRWINADYSSICEALFNAKQHAEEIASVRKNLSENYEEGIFTIDYNGILARFKTEYGSVLKVFKKKYQEDKKTFLLHSKQIGKKITDAEMLETIDALRKIEEHQQWYRSNEMLLNEYFGSDVVAENSDFQGAENHLHIFSMLKELLDLVLQLQNISKEFADNEASIQKHFGILYSGVFTDWESASSAWKWADHFRDVVLREAPSKLFVERVCESKEYATKSLAQKTLLQDARESVQRELKWFAECFDEPREYDSTDFESLYQRVEACLNGLSLLEEWIDFRTARKRCVTGGLGGYVSAIEENSIPSENILPVFKKRFFRLWLDAVLPDYPAVLYFRRKLQESTISEFAELDKTQFNIARARIKGKLINDLPSMEHFTSGADEISILKRELAKQRRIMPIRKLFREIPNLLLTLKPCLMMSPLSVSLFLEADSYQFDIVIFDEASQVFTENAIGAIARGKQVVIAGDSKQLPPTNFFQASVTEDNYDYDEDDDTDDVAVFDSIIDEANLLPERTLRWHYRSRHESLIAFSNAKIYKNRLVTFPSNIEQGKDNGVEYIHVADGFYDRGGRKGNIPEARKVAQLVFEHIKKQPNRSLGVIAFGEVQQIAIENALREMRLANQEYEGFFAEDKEEAFFVKSLENVQGDERDTIIFSIGYAPDANGTFRMNFGPLGKSGGERRLNVAITRAKYNVKLVGSILPTDINVDSISTEGPKLLRAYMDYAINGANVLQREITEEDIADHDSPFEEAVYRFLERRGYKLGTQVGCSGFRIDIGVKHPTLSGVYVLGVECDGASYHSAKTARERDRLRQDILENMGWTIYRVWSTDWIKDPIVEGQKLIEAIDNAIASYKDKNRTLFSAPEQTKAEEYVHVETKKTPGKDAGNPYGFPKFKPIDLNSIPRVYGVRRLTDCIAAIINNEYPIHYDILCQRVAGELGNEKATVKVRREVDVALQCLKGFVRKDDFFFPRGYQEVPVRVPNTRKIQYIHQEELAAAMMTILKSFVGANRKALMDETARVYDFSRTGPQISTAMNSAIDYLIKKKRVEELEGKLRIL